MSKRSPALESSRSELIVLLLLMEADRTGYEIRSLIREWNIDRYLPVSPTTIYRALQRLEAVGCLTSQPRQLGRYPVSTVYSITAKGKRRYRGHLLAESVFARTAFSLDPFLGLAAFLDNDTRREVVGEWKQAARKRYEEVVAAIKDKSRGPGHTYGKVFSEWLLLDHERDMLKAELAWMDKYLEIGMTEPRR